MRLKPEIRPSHVSWQLRMVCIFVLAVLALAIVPFRPQALARSESFTPAWPLVTDRANLLDSVQEQTVFYDSWWLNSVGTPFQVVTELALATPQSARQRASELRIDHRIESTPGADDGLVLYAAVNPGSRSEVVIGLSAGPQATSGSGLTGASLEGIAETIVATQLDAGHPDRAIVYSIREMIYLKEFVPPASAPLTGWRADMQQALAFTGPLVAIVCVAGAVAGIRHSSMPAKAQWIWAASLALVASILLIPSVQAQSGLGVISGIAIVVIAGVWAWKADRARPDSTTRSLVVTPRPPNTRLRAGSRS